MIQLDGLKPFVLSYIDKFGIVSKKLTVLEGLVENFIVLS